MISKNIENVKQQVARAAFLSGKSLQDIQIVYVTKYAKIEDVIELIRLGYYSIGENRLQEINRKKNILNDVFAKEVMDKIQWHFIGHLQSNKARQVADFAYLVQSVDSFKIADKLNKAALDNKKKIDILIQVNIASEDAKSGISFSQTEDFFKNIAVFRELNIKGIMAIGPYYDDPEDSRPGFKAAKACFDKVNGFLTRNAYPEMEILSMGMSHDYVVAIEEGANMVRIGSAVFGG